MTRLRPIPLTGVPRPAGALPLAGSATVCFLQVERLRRGTAPEIVGIADLDPVDLERLSSRRPPVLNLTLDRPRLMGILNVTPDSFSDGGRFLAPDAAQARAAAMAADGAEVIDIGGESTRPGAATVPAEEEIARIAPVIRAVAAGGPPVSVDTRKAPVAAAALAAGAALVNDVSAFAYDPDMAGLAAARGVPVCLMHAQGRPETMQRDPRYDDVLLDVLDHLEDRIAAAEAAGIPRRRIVIDPGIGFGKTQEHNLALLARLSAFHDLGCALLLGASRKRFIGTIGGTGGAEGRGPGSLAVALAAAAQGVHFLRVHDVAETRQALALWRAATTGETG